MTFDAILSSGTYSTPNLSDLQTDTVRCLLTLVKRIAALEVETPSANLPQYVENKLRALGLTGEATRIFRESLSSTRLSIERGGQ